jgi:hypothetical protein
MAWPLAARAVEQAADHRVPIVLSPEEVVRFAASQRTNAKGLKIKATARPGTRDFFARRFNSEVQQSAIDGMAE